MKRLKPAHRELTPRMKQVVQYVFDHPEQNQKQIAEAIGIGQTRVSYILRSDRVLASFPTLARAKVKSLVPKAIKRYGELLEQTENLEVSRKVADRLLDTNKVLEPETKISVNIFAQVPTKDLIERVCTSQNVSANDSVDTEIVTLDEETE